MPTLSHGTPEDTADFKLSIALLYESQIDRELADRIAHFSERYQGAERLWVNELWLAAASGERLSTETSEAESLLQ